ncbi:MAG: argininosuccinate lyase [Deltaproteobacteria bacterium]|nr:MAG: argininosuccinate lyase [Deltaproteobacteria bacterium]
MSEKPWDGRFNEKTDYRVERFTSSIDIDRRLYAYDIEGSIAHCRMLASAGIITSEEAATLIQGLETIRREIERGQFEFDDGLEDIHMHIEARLLQVAGKVAQKLHTARSRNDQVALDVRMYLKAATRAIVEGIVGMEKAIVALARRHLGLVMPGYTHLQRAQPVLLSHHLMAYYEMFTRDVERFRECLKRIDVMPLGTAALAGTTYPIDREQTAELLGFARISANSIDSVADRDFIIEFLAAAAICMMHFSRLGEELVLWSSSEFAFVDLPDAFATGSSIMPQKKNPDVPELVRGKTGRVVGDLVAMLTIMKSLPLAYDRDMQEDKQPMMDAVDTLQACIEVVTGMLPRLKFNSETMRAAASKGFLNATDMADYLVMKGVPFREAHSSVGQAVSYALDHKKELQELTLEELKKFSGFIDEDIFDVLTVEQMIDRRKSAGGTATANVKAAIEAAEERFSGIDA